MFIQKKIRDIEHFKEMVVVAIALIITDMLLRIREEIEYRLDVVSATIELIEL